MAVRFLDEAPATPQRVQFLDEPPPQAERPGLLERFGVNVRDRYYNSLFGSAQTRELPKSETIFDTPPEEMAPGVITLADSPFGEMAREELAKQAALEEQARQEAIARRAAFDQRMESFPPPRGILENVVAGAGQLTPTSPEDIFGPATAAGRRLVTRLLDAGAKNAVIEGAVDPLVQRNQIEAGLRQEYDRTQTVLSMGGAFLLGSGLRGAGEALPRIAQRVGSWFRKAPEEVTIADVEAAVQESPEIAADPRVQEFLAATGAQTTDPAVAERFAERIAAADARAGDPVETIRQAQQTVERSDLDGGRPVQSQSRLRREIRRQDEEIAQLREELRGILAGEIDPSFSTLSQPRPAAPDVIQLGQRAAPVVREDGEIQTDVIVPDRAVEEGTQVGFERNAPAQYGRRLALPAPERASRLPMTEEQVAQARASAAGGRAPDPQAGPDRLTATTDGRSPMTRDQAVEQRQAGEAFRLAEARRKRYEAAVTEEALGRGPGDRADVRAGGRPTGLGPEEEFVYLDARIDKRSGEMRAGERVEIIDELEDGTVEVRFPDRPEMSPVVVDPKRLSVHSRPARPRQAQEFMAASRAPRKGVGTTMPGPRRAVDRVASRQAGGLVGDVLPPQRAASADDAPPPRGGPTIDATAWEPPPAPSSAPRVAEQPSPRGLPAPESLAPRGRPLGQAPQAGEPFQPTGWEKYRNTERTTGYTIRPGDRRWLEGEIHEIVNSDSGYIMPRIDPNDPYHGSDWRNEIIGVKGTAPEWFKKSGLSRKQIEKVGNKLLNGEPITRGESWIADALLRAARDRREADVRDMVAYREARVRENPANEPVVQDMLDQADDQIDQVWDEYDWVPDGSEAMDIAAPRYDDPEDIPFPEVEASDGGNAQNFRSGDTRPAGEGRGGIEEGRPDAGTARDAPRVEDAPGEQAADAGDAGAIDRIDAGDQRVIPGAERDARGANQRRADAPIKPEVEQKGVDGLELFDPDSRPTSQRSLFEGEFGAGVNPIKIGRAVVDTLRDLGVLDRDAGFFGELARGLKDGTRNAYDWARVAWTSNDAYLRGLARRFKSKTLEELADLFFAPPGTGRAVGEAYQHAVDRHATRNVSELERLTRPWRKDEKALAALRDLIVNPHKNTGKTEIEKAARRINEMLDAEWEYRRAAGEDIGRVRKGYFPRIINWDKVAKAPGGVEGFKAKLAQLYQRKGVRDPKAAADAYYDALLNEHMGLDQPSLIHSPDPWAIARSAEESRVFDKEADNILKDYLEDDVFSVLTAYFNGSAKRAEFVRRFGKKGAVGSKERAEWEKLHGDKTQMDVYRERIIEEVKASGVEGFDFGQVTDTLRSNLGTLGASQTKRGTRKFISFMHTWNILGTMDRATLTSMSELAMIGMRTGSMRLAMSGLRDSFNEFGRALAKAKPSEAREWAEALGVVNDAILEAMMQSRVSGLQDSKLHQRITSGFFKATLLHQFTEGTRVAALKAGRHFLWQLARDLDKGPSRAKRAAFYLKELGIENPQEFGKWLKSKNGVLSLDEAMAGKGAAGDYAKALARFIDQTIMRPTRAERPRWANHPVGSLFYGLMSFSFSFKKNVIDRQWRLAKRAIKDRDPAFLASGAIGLPMMLGITYVVDTYVRPGIFGSGYDFENEDAASMALRVIDRAGGTGALSPIINAFLGVRYERDLTTSLSGPAIGRMAQAAEAIVKLFANNTESTDTAERNLLRQIYRVAVEPMMDALAIGAFSKVARTAAVMGTGGRNDEDWFVDTVGSMLGLESETKGANRGRVRDRDARRRRTREPRTR